MALIALEGMRFYAYHGFYPEEQIIGNEYVVDVYIDANTQVAAATDDLYRTVNYETVYLICQAEMRKPTQLLEALVQRIVSKINDIFSRDVKGLKVRVKKMNPPLRGRVGCSFVEIDNLSSGGKGGGGGSRGFGGLDNMNLDGGGFGRGGFGGFGDNDNIIPDFGDEEDTRGGFENIADLLGQIEEGEDEDFEDEDFDEEEIGEEFDDEDLDGDFDEEDMDLDIDDLDDLDLDDLDLDDLDLEGFDFDDED